MLWGWTSIPFPEQRTGKKKGRGFGQTRTMGETRADEVFYTEGKTDGKELIPYKRNSYI